MGVTSASAKQDYVTQEDLEAAASAQAEGLFQVSSALSTRIQELEQKVDILEKQISLILVGYGEMTVVIEGLVSQLVYASEEEKQAFLKRQGEARKEMLEILRDQSDVDQGNPESITPVESLDREDNSSTSS